MKTKLVQRFCFGTEIKILLIRRNDSIIISDCLFFIKYHKDLAITIKQSLNNDGKCIIITPKRGSTMIDFITIAESCDLKVQMSNDTILNDLMLDNSSYSSNLIILTN